MFIDNSWTGIMLLSRSRAIIIDVLAITHLPDYSGRMPKYHSMHRYCYRKSALY